MRPGKYTVRELFANKDIFQIIVPEIQRDYVWGEQQVLSLMESLKNDFTVFSTAQFQVAADDEQIRYAFTEYYRRQKYSSNIGFIYAYNDVQYDRQYFLIDGQQRLTTIYLLLLALASMAGRQEDFRNLYFNQEVLKLDYKVREAAHEFLKHFIKHVLSGKDHHCVKDEHWYFTVYNDDRTIKSVISNYGTIVKNLKGCEAGKLYDHIQNYLDFWYFDTNISEQGEELYIYMNARGEQMQSNENLKALLLAKLDSEAAKNEKGRLWEDWQDFFWLNKGVHENADKGFNEFLCCITGLENHGLQDKIILDKESFDKKGISASDMLQLLTIEKVERYVAALKQVLDTTSQYRRSAVHYCGWVDKFETELWKVINQSRTNWFASLTDPNRGQEHSRMVFVWSVLYYFINQKENLLEKDIRFLRLYYVRYNNYDRSVVNLLKRVDHIVQHSAWDTDAVFFSDDEVAKHRYLSGLKGEEQAKAEALIWQIEDHRYNLDGSDVKAINISHLVDFDKEISLDVLQRVCDRFLLIFSAEPGYGEKVLVNLLLHYGKFWRQVSPWYYQNFEFGNWRRVIRNMDGDAFDLFFKEFCALEKPVPLQDLLDQKTRHFLLRNLEGFAELTALEHQLIIYSILLEDLWQFGYYIAANPNQTLQRLFKKEPLLYNTQGDFRGSYHFELWSTCSKQFVGDMGGIVNYLTNKSRIILEESDTGTVSEDAA